jgi:predicted dithiol-disulfide oxidoreductase (DUF899 family)
MQQILTRIFKKHNSSAMKIQYLHFFELWILKLLGNKTFKIDSSYICTSNNAISVGKEFQYREGSMLEQVIIEDISFKDFFINVKAFFSEQDRRVICTHLMTPRGYSGMWRIWDKNHYDIEEWRR